MNFQNKQSRTRRGDNQEDPYGYRVRLGNYMDDYGTRLFPYNLIKFFRHI